MHSFWNAFESAATPLAGRLAAPFLASLWQALAMVLLAAGLIRAGGGLNPKRRFLLWTAVLLLSAFLAFVPTGSHEHAATGGVALPSYLAVLLVAAWFVLAGVRLLQLAVGAFRLNRMLREATLVSPDATMQALLEASPRRPRLAISSEALRPCVAGFLRPRILLPPDLMATLTPEELEQVVRHELEHLRRGDDWTNLMQQVVLALLPLNPVLVWVHRRLCSERELACDDGVIGAGVRSSLYAGSLVRVAEVSLLRRGLQLALAALGADNQASEFAQRIHRILRGPEPASAGRARLKTAGALAGVVAGAGVLLAGPTGIHIAQPSSPSVAMVLPAGIDSSVPGVTSQTLRNVSATVPSGEPRATLVKAVAMPQKSAFHRTSLVVRMPWRHRRTPREIAQQGSGPLQRANMFRFGQGRVVLTGFAPESQPVLAAVPWQGGWLIVQL